MLWHIVKNIFDETKSQLQPIVTSNVITHPGMPLVAELLMEFHRTARLHHWMVQFVQLWVPSTMKISVSFHGQAPLLLLQAVHWFLSYLVKTWLQRNQCVGKNQVRWSSDDGSDIKQMQLLCYECTLKETKRLAKGVALVFRMFHLDQCLPKDCLSRQGGLLLYGN